MKTWSMPLFGLVQSLDLTWLGFPNSPPPSKNNCIQGKQLKPVLRCRLWLLYWSLVIMMQMQCAYCSTESDTSRISECKWLAVKYLMCRTQIRWRPLKCVHANQTVQNVRGARSDCCVVQLKDKTHLVDEGSKAVVEVLDLLFLLGADSLDVGVDV